MLLTLASQSPRRARILAEHGVEFTVLKTDAPEVSIPDEPERTVVENARAKLMACSARPALAADTIVWYADRIYGKPRDVEEAREFLRTFSGKTHSVFTGVAYDDGTGAQTRCVRSDVTFKSLTDADIDAYIELVKPLDRAGAYDIAEHGEMLVAAFAGSYENVVGLPLEPLREFGLIL